MFHAVSEEAHPERSRGTSFSPHRLWLAAALALAACNPDLAGECVSDPAVCPSGTRCLDGLCISNDILADGGTATTTDGGAGTDGGTPDGSTPVTATIEITSPPTGKVIGPGPFEVTMKVTTTGTTTSASVEAEQFGTAVSTEVAATTGGDTWKATLNAASPGFADGAASITGKALVSGKSFTSPSVSVAIDKTGPVIVIKPMPYPVRAAQHPATGAFLRNESFVIEVEATDAPAGVAGPPTLQFDSYAPLIGTPAGANTWRYAVNARSPALAGVERSVSFTVTAKDTVGNESSVLGSFKLSRRLWSWTKPRGGPINASPAFVTDAGGSRLLVVGADDGYVYALRRAEGALAWDYDAGSEVTDHIAIGEDGVYASTREGRVHALFPADATLLPSLRRRWRCPDIGLDGQLRDLAGGVALTKTVRSAVLSGLQVETAVAVTRDGRLRVFRGAPWPTGAVGESGCSRVFDLNTDFDRVTPVVVSESGTIMTYVGNQDSELQKRSLVRQSDGQYQVGQVWTYDVGDTIESPVAVGVRNGATVVMVGRRDGKMRALDQSMNVLWSPGRATFSTPFRGGATISGDAFFGIDDKGRVKKLSIQTADDVWAQPAQITVRSDNANAGVVVAADGKSYAASGPQLGAISADGVVEWTYDTRPNGAGPANRSVDRVTPLLGCDGTIYIAESDAQGGSVHALLTDSLTGPALGPWARTGRDGRGTFSFDAASPGTCAD